MMGKLIRLILYMSLLIVFWALPPSALAISVALEPSIESPAAVGTVVTWLAAADSTSGYISGNIWYRFRVRRPGQEFRVIKDFSPSNSFDWTASDFDGPFEIEVTARDLETGESATRTRPFLMQSRVVSGGAAMISPTSHPLVFLYSAPPCPAGSRIFVEFGRADGGAIQRTPFRDCQPGLSINFYVAGLRAGTQYTASHLIETGSASKRSSRLPFTTGDILAANLPEHNILNGPPPVVNEGVLLEATLFSNPVATDIEGNVIWYYPSILSFLTRPSGEGRFFGIMQVQGADQSKQVIREFDLTAMTLRETNAARVNEQLLAMGKRTIGGFHHEARLLPDGRIATLASVEQIMSGVQGSDPVNIVGDMIIVLDPDMQVVWTWDGFDFLDVRRLATLDDKCSPGSCPPLYLASAGNDWLHGNSLQLTPDGSFLYSVRSQDWVIKIDYANGNGSGNVLWRLGKDGDFRFISQDPYPWFSHQHDPQMLADNQSLLLFDNGNVRNANDPAATSRGQLIYLDEVNMTASFLLNVDLGQYSFALGSAQTLTVGNYHFENGFLSDATSLAIEVDPEGNTVYTLRGTAPAYRSFRLKDLYTP